MITKDELLRFCYRLPRNENTYCVWAMSLELAHHYTSLEEPIILGNQEMADRIGYTKRTVIREKPRLLEDGYWEAVPSTSRRTAYVPTAKLINAIEGAKNV